jgi:hypothetical protein
MASWGDFAAAEPTLASAIRTLVCQYGSGLAYLATVRADGGPRVHPVAPVITDEGLFCFIIDSPKRRDLDRDGRYALHAFPPEMSDDEAYLAGRVRPVTDPVLLATLARSMRAEPRVDWKLYEFSVDVAMVVRREARSESIGSASKTVWRDPAVAGGGAARPVRQRQRKGPCAAAADSVQ